MARFTDADHVALYDGTTMRAFGPIFESEAHAEDFTLWLAEARRDHSAGCLPAKGGRWADPGAFSDSALLALEAEWKRQRCDIDGFLLDPASST